MPAQNYASGWKWKEGLTVKKCKAHVVSTQETHLPVVAFVRIALRNLSLPKRNPHCTVILKQVPGVLRSQRQQKFKFAQCFTEPKSFSAFPVLWWLWSTDCFVTRNENINTQPKESSAVSPEVLLVQYPQKLPRWWLSKILASQFRSTKVPIFGHPPILSPPSSTEPDDWFVKGYFKP